MKTYSVGEFKARFSEILKWVQAGEEIAISFGKGKEVVAYLIPNTGKHRKKRNLGILSGKASATFSGDFKITIESFLAE